MSKINQEIINKAREYAESEVEANRREWFFYPVGVGQRLAEKLKADKDIVMLGTLLMDLKLRQAILEKRIPEHIQMSLEAAKDFLSRFEIDEEIKERVINCVKEHHGVKNYSCIESEICANADCYKFLDPKEFLTTFYFMAEDEKPIERAINWTLSKIDEKEKAITLDVCKKELGDSYKKFREILMEAKK